ESTNIDITVPEPIRTLSISGRVINAETGFPVAGVEITWGVMSNGSVYPGYVGLPGDRTRANGEFHLRGLTPGKYAVLPRASSDNEFYGEPVMCDLSDGDASGIEIKVRPGGSISGFVVIEGTNDPKALAKLTQPSLNVFFSPNQSRISRIDNPKINPPGVCESEHKPLLDEISVTARRDTPPPPALILLRPYQYGGWMKDRGDSTINYLDPSRYFIIARPHNENWYAKSIALPAGPARRSSVRSGPGINVGRNGVTLKSGDRVTGLIVTITNG